MMRKELKRRSPLPWAGRGRRAAATRPKRSRRMAAQTIDLATAVADGVPAEIAVFSYYRNAEQHGSNLLFRLLRHLDDPDAQIALSQHLADETRHAWLWTERIIRAGA